MNSVSSPISLGIDLGTSGLKATLLTEDGVVVGTASVPLSTSYPQPGWAEQNPDDWWDACVAALSELREKLPAAYSRVCCIGLSGQMHGAVLLDRNNQSIRPTILWNDARSVEEARWLAERFASLTEVTGSVAMAGLTASKFLWVRNNEPEAFRAIDCVMLPKDYLRLKLTGERMTDMSDAAGTLCLDVRGRTWFEPMIEATGLTLEQFPALGEGNSVAGCLSSEAAGQLKLNRNVVVACGGGDNPASAVGIAATNPGDSFVTLGTSAAFVSVTDKPLERIVGGVHGFCHALPQRWYAMGAILCGANSLRWVTQLLSMASEQALLDLASQQVPLGEALSSEAPLFLPYLSGERTPHNDPLVRGGFMNVGIETSPALFGYAVLEGVAFALRDAMASVEASGVSVGRCALVGGGAKSDYWAQLLANVLDRELHTLAGSELAAVMGAAKLGFAAYGADTLQLARPLAVKSVFVPNAARVEPLQERYRKFRGLFSAAQSLRS
jgi:xylulokinase